MVPCPFCQNEISRSARSCVHCNRAQPPRAKAPTSSLWLVMRIAPVGWDLLTARPIELVEGVATMVGRESQGDIGKVMDAIEHVVDDVSREHVWLTARGRQLEIRDVSSRGTFIDDDRIPRDEQTFRAVPVSLRLASGCIVDVQLEDRS
jgi:hypothetical protein